ncbi:MAG: bifunctional (p)ppGpp synthetase/guanosine-3',5'-bis(diphosphate) 3'-pyrophosphohydrolase [Clostridia bacterium]|nr:bifunctional (p)ppGpp synthetase/guanosine-3',5'-bis(diphosphate) 3'-pyrophosphohydrolase [Clostridia bacterium]
MEHFSQDIERIIEKYLKYGRESQVDAIRQAFAIAFDAHKEQRRKSGEPYIIHPLSVAELLADMAMDSASICAALLHDVLEDTDLSYKEMERMVGTEIAELVDGLTKLDKLQFHSKEEEEMENLRKMFLAMARDIRVIIIKLNDRLHNIRTLHGMREAKRREYALETMEIYAPIAHRLGITRIEHEMEDTCLRTLDPIGYQEILDGLESRKTNDDFLASIAAHIEEVMAREKISCKVASREKNIYSIYRKLFVQNRSLDDIYDLYALRIIVDTKTDCYNVLGLIHDMYKPVPGRFKDYISTPKPNMYQSLHTTVMSRDGVSFEVQIRTWDMHHVAEYGIAAHWKYKHGLKGMSADDEKLAWIRKLMESQQDSDADDFIHSMKVDLFDDEVYVFTPKGDVIALPVGSNPIDMAYAIHSAVGNRLVGAKVNGRMVPIDYTLKNGEVCEILTSSASRGPSRDWLSIVKTGEARNKIRQWYKKEKREENMALGRDMLMGEIKKQRLSTAIMDEIEAITRAANKLSYKSAEDLIAGIGYGGITPQRALNRIKDELCAMAKDTPSGIDTDTALEAVFEKAKLKEPPPSGILVEGLNSCLIKFAKCCTPVPGDEIVGFVTRGYGVSVHRATCRNMESIAFREGDEENRLVNVHWHVSQGTTFPASIQVMAQDRFGLLADIANIIANMRVAIGNMNAKPGQNGFVDLYFSINVTDRTQLDSILKRIHAVRSVIEVKRVG